jgi:hypothetical protein
MSDEAAELVEELSKGTFQLQSAFRGIKEERIKDLTEKRNQAIVKLLNSIVNPNPKDTLQHRRYQEKCNCIFITQYTDQIIQYEAALASENFWNQQQRK